MSEQFLDGKMAKKTIDLGTGPNTKDGDTVRIAFGKVNENFTEVYDILTTLGGETGNTSIIDVSIRGDVYSQDDLKIIDFVTGKLNTASVPNDVPLRFSFTATFRSNGNLESLQDLPDGWTYVKNGNLAIITHNVYRNPSMVSYWGFSAIEGLRLRYPTAGYQASVSTNTLKLNLNSAVTGADNGQYATITVLF